METTSHTGPDTPAVTLKMFTFEDAQESLSVSIPEVLDAQYGMYVWPCAVVLAQYIWSRRVDVKDKTVLELGAGVSLPGVLASRCGAKVLLSDDANTPECLQNCRRSCEANGLHGVVTLPLTWGEVSPQLIKLPHLDLIVASDVFYEPRDFEDILVTVAFLLRKNPKAQFWVTYQERSADWSIEALLHKWNLACVDVDLETFDADKSELAGSNLPGNHTIQMMIMTLKTDKDT
ncbi:methyltransferase-like protein 23 isoform X1 [Syngnathus typhle]|uniref:methyltransferase-like protein 23 isoform X1 n=1 Tax=Syngnathus typhle TaxID=161592 RepID=UPI002A6A83EF|nr:methyltransferase-like protein 23 isoform X1 [Syngnathus typhle]